MYLPLSRFVCLLLAVVASHYILVVGTGGEKQQDSLPPNQQNNQPNIVVPEAVSPKSGTTPDDQREPASDSKPATEPAPHVDVSTQIQPTNAIAVPHFHSDDAQPNLFSQAEVELTQPIYSQSAYELPTDAVIVEHPGAVAHFDSPSPWSHEVLIMGEASQVCDSLGNSLEDAQNANLVSNGRHRQHAAPEVVLRFTSDCHDANFVNWKLSSRDKPCAELAIPHGPLMVEMLTDKPVDFVEMMFDGKPLKPTHYSNGTPLQYSLPCPAPGHHWLQARFLSGNVWSQYSKPIRFESRLPQQPRIIAASDWDRDPTLLARTSVASITTHSIKVYLADVNHGDHVVAYVDGKPLPPRDAHDGSIARPAQADDHNCCRVFRVEGAVTPGMHKLSVRVAGCSRDCSITSQASNTISFHYYDDAIYLLRPGAGCDNKPLNAMQSSYLIPTKAANTIAEVASMQSTVDLADGSSAHDANSDRVSKFHFVAYEQPVNSPGAMEAHAAASKAQAEVNIISADVENVAKRSTELVLSSREAVDLASVQVAKARSYLKEAAVQLENARSQASKAENAVEKTKKQPGGMGEAADQVASARRLEAQEHARLTSSHLNAAANQYEMTRLEFEAAQNALGEVKNRFEACQEHDNRASAEFARFNESRQEVLKAVQSAAVQLLRETVALKERDEQKVKEALDTLSKARNDAQFWSRDSKLRADFLKTHVDRAQTCRDRAWVEASNAREAADKANQHLQSIKSDSQSAMEAASKADHSANSAGRLSNMQASAAQAWREAQEAGAYEAAKATFDAANAGSDENGVRYTQETTKEAERLASQAWTKATARIAKAEADASRARADMVVGPPSPFYFAAAAHFPLRDFGLRGEPLDRDGIIIYEDMEFSFDREGNYQVRFRASSPPMPATVRLQFQIQPHRNGPWYTVSLAPIEFPFPSTQKDGSKCAGDTCGQDHGSCGDDSSNCCGKTRECVCSGHSEILKRCYATMGHDATIRRSGTARMGFGIPK